MAIRYFVHEGMQFRTIDIAPTVLGFEGADNIAVTVLEDVVLNLTDTGAFTPLLDGADQTVKMNTLTSYWTTRQPGISEVRRDVMNARAPLIEPLGTTADADDTSGTPATYNLHKEANRWILPQGFDHVIQTPNAANMPVGGMRLTLVKAMIFDHTNIAKFTSDIDAWDAYNSYFLTLGLTDEIVAARSAYFVNPDAAMSSA